MKFGGQLAEVRRLQKLSQHDLSMMSGVSQRQISFLETGRAAPRKSTIDRLVKGLELNFRQKNNLYLAGGFTTPHPEFDLSDPRFAPVLDVMRKLLSSHSPNPAVATLRNGTLIQGNSVFYDLLNMAFGTMTPWRCRPDEQDNLYLMTLHPEGLRRFMQNPEAVIPHTLRRLKQTAKSDASAGAILRAAMAYPGIGGYARQALEEGDMDGSVLIEEYRIKGRPLNIISMVASLGSPEDVTAQNLQVELFFPCDQASEQTLLYVSK